MIAKLKHCFYSIFHPVNGFDEVKWNNGGSVKLSFVILLCFFLANLISAQSTGFVFNMNNPDTISAPAIFTISVGGVLLWFVANWSVSSLMFAEGKLNQIFIVTCYALVPYIIFELVIVVASNLISIEMGIFLVFLRIIGIGWSCLLMLFGMYQIHQLEFGKLVGNLLLTIFGIAIMLFLMVLLYSLFQQLYTFVFTIINEITFRL